MKLYIHAHFAYLPVEDRDIPDLLSLAIIAEDGQTFYGVLDNAENLDDYCTDYVSEKLMSFTDKRESPDDFRERLRVWLNRFTEPVFVYNYYLHYHYLQILGFGRIPGIRLDIDESAYEAYFTGDNVEYVHHSIYRAMAFKLSCISGISSGSDGESVPLQLGSYRSKSIESKPLPL